MRDINIEWLTRAAEFDHLFQTRWLGERFFHLPGDMLALQELIWRARPDCIVQTGIAAGGGVVFSASMLELTGATAASSRSNRACATRSGSACNRTGSPIAWC